MQKIIGILYTCGLIQNSYVKVVFFTRFYWNLVMLVECQFWFCFFCRRIFVNRLLIIELLVSYHLSVITSLFKKKKC